MTRGVQVVTPIGSVFGSWEVLGDPLRGKHGYEYLCRCSCGTEANVLGTALRAGQSNNCVECKKSYPNYEGLVGSYMTRLMHGAQERGIVVYIDLHFLWEVWLKQKGKCALTGESLMLMKGRKDNDFTASVDRIDSDLGYVPGNVQWVHKTINLLKNSYSEEDFVKMCKAVAAYRR